MSAPWWLRWREAIDWPVLGDCLFVVLPLVVLSLWRQDPGWLHAALMASATLIGVTRVGLAPLGVLLQALAAIAGFLLLFFSLRHPWLFVFNTVMLAVLAVGVSYYGQTLRSLGNFVFIPALYLACETAGGSQPEPYAARALAFLPYLFAGFLPVLLLALLRHRTTAGDRWRNLLRWRNDGPLGARPPLGRALLATGLAVAVAAAVVAWRRPGHGEWLVWSAVSVVTGDLVSTRRKLGDRAAGAAIGVPAGILAGQLLPHTTSSVAALAPLTVVTLLAFRNYRVGFATRSGCIACALIVAGQGAAVAAQRVENVLVGGAIGLLCMLLLTRIPPRVAPG